MYGRTIAAVWLALILFTGGCATIPGNQVDEQVRPMMVGRELGEDALLDVALQVFDPGELPEDPKKRQGLSQSIRQAEARFLPIHLKYTLQRTGYWGTVRVVPGNEPGAELLISGKIKQSDGESMVVSVEVVDALNRVWFRKTYAETAKEDEHEQIEPEKNDTFQDLFNTIGNDLALYRESLTPQEVEKIRNAAALRFAEAMAPDIYGGYLSTSDTGELTIQHLPSRDDPMYERIRTLQTRDDMLVDVINGYYDNYYLELWEPYGRWRKYRSVEVSAMRELEQQALTRQLLGIASIVGAIAIGATSDSDTRVATDSLRDVMILGGAAAVYSGYQKSKETEINRDAIQELGDSFSAEADPLTIEVEGETVRLTGSAEQQYTRWREILREIHRKETGLPLHREQSDLPAPGATE